MCEEIRDNHDDQDEISQEIVQEVTKEVTAENLRRSFAKRCNWCEGWTNNLGQVCVQCMNKGHKPYTQQLFQQKEPVQCLTYCDCAGCGITIVGASSMAKWLDMSEEWQLDNPIVVRRVFDRPYCRHCIFRMEEKVFARRNGSTQGRQRHV